MPRPVRLLLVDPSRERAQRLCDTLAVGWRLERVSDAPAAVDALADGAYDALVVAIDDERDPARPLRRLVAHAGGVPVVALGATGERAELAVDAGAFDCLGRESVDAASALARVLRRAIDHGRLVAERDHARRLAVHLAHHDSLTDLPNRQLFRGRLRQLISLARRRHRSLAVLVLDLDRFKRVNETRGHAFGDRVLQRAARRIASCVRATDTAARRGGDELTILLDGIERGRDAARVAEKILDALARPIEVDDDEVQLGASIGISLFPADGDDVDALIQRADIAMYRAKASGGNCYRFYLPDMDDRASERVELERALRHALEVEQFELVYQPQVDLADGRIIAFEALVRWRHPELGMIFPDEFIPLAEETGLVVPLGDWVLREACRQNRAWQRAGLPKVAVGVNVSARQFQQKLPVERVAAALRDTELDPEWLELELTESAVMRDPSLAIDILGSLRELGVSVAIDDFGTGHSTLAYLKRFPIARLKIDKTFVRTLLVDPKDAAITRAIVGMAHSLRLAAVAEGVETAAQAEALRAAACDHAQGYWFSRPVPPADAARLLERDALPVG